MERIFALIDELQEIKSRLKVTRHEMQGLEVETLKSCIIEIYRELAQLDSPREIGTRGLRSGEKQTEAPQIDRDKRPSVEVREIKEPQQKEKQEIPKPTPIPDDNEDDLPEDPIARVYALARRKSAGSKSIGRAEKPTEKTPEGRSFVANETRLPSQVETSSTGSKEEIQSGFKQEENNSDQKQAPKSRPENPQNDVAPRDKVSINDRFAQQHVKKNLADKLKLSPISDLRTAIGINQRIAIINNLFGGNDKEYKKSMQFINNCKNFSEAKYYLQTDIATVYSWNEESPLVQDFMELVYRKFL
ncbi:MAG: hypothetical protein M3Q97_05170 [Bacteroidota bacterium]|nr:hypothetical protein [Bacteroidota bacterium]